MLYTILHYVQVRSAVSSQSRAQARAQALDHQQKNRCAEKLG
jgi:hypothetical protein